jgi:hypothetical protein
MMQLTECVTEEYMEDDGLGEMLDPSLDLRDEDLMTRG